MNLKYNFVYKKSTKDKDIVIGQSIKAGSEVASNITITITLSNGNKETKSTVNRRENSTSSNTGKSSNNNSSNASNNTPSPSPSPSQSTDNCSLVMAYLQTGNKYDETVSMINRANSKLKFTYTRVSKCSNGNSKAGVICNADSYDGKMLSTCKTYNLQVVE